MKRLWLMVLFAVAVGALLVRWNWESLVELARQRAERELAAAFHASARIRSLRVSLLPLQLWAEGIEVGSEQAVLQLDTVEARLAALSSIAEGRPVFTAQARGIYVDLLALPRGRESGVPVFSVPPFRVGVARISDLRVRFPMGDEAALLSVEHLRAHGDSSLFRTQVSANVRLRGGRIARGPQVLDFDSIRVVAHATSDGLTIESASLKGAGRSVEILGEGPHLHRLRLALDVRDLAIIDDGFLLYRGSGTGTGTMTGPLSALAIDGHLRIEDLRVADRPIGVLTAAVRHRGDTSRFENAHLRSDAGDLRGTVVVGYSGVSPLEATIEWNVNRVETALNTLGVKLGLDQTLGASSIIKGQLDPLELVVTAEGVMASGATTAALHIHGRVDEESAEIDLALSQDGRTRIAGQIAVREGVLDGRVDLETADSSAMANLAPQALAALDLVGTLRGTVFLRGSVSKPRLEGRVAGGPLGVSGVPVEHVRGGFAWQANQLTLENVELHTAGGGEAHASGSVALNDSAANEWELKVHRVDSDLLLGIASRFATIPGAMGGGTVSATIECRGKWREPAFQVEAAADAVRVLGETFSRIELRGGAQGSQWKLDARGVHASTAVVEIAGHGASIADAEVEISVRTLDLEKLATKTPLDLAGRINVEGRLRGNLLVPGGQLTASASDFVVAGEKIGRLDVQAEGHAGMWTLTGQAPERLMRFSARTSAREPFPYEFRVEWQDFAIESQARDREPLGLKTSGEIVVHGELKAWRSPQVRLHVAELDLTWRDVSLRAASPVRITGSKGRFELEPVTLAGRETEITLAGSFDQGELTAVAKGSVSLAYAELVGDPIESAAGRIDLDLKAISPDLQRWQAEGTATIVGGVLDFGIPGALTDVGGVVEFAGHRARIRQLGAKSGAGWLRLSGEVDLQTGPMVAWEAESFPLNLQAGLETVIGGSGRLDGKGWRDLTLSGAVMVQSAVYTQDVEIVDIPALFAPRVQRVAQVAPPPVIVRLDLAAQSSGGLYVDNNVAQVELSLDMDIKGTIRRPRLMGSVSIVGGQVRIRRRTFELTGGTADFRGRIPPNPTLNINAETAVYTREADYLITATVTGTARDPVVQLSADDPTLTQTDLVALVTVGRTAGEAQGESGGVGRVDALALVPTAPVEERVTELVGIDRFEIDLAQTNSQGNVSPGVTIGKNITERFRAALTTSFDVATHNVVGLEYDLTRRISLIGQWEAATESEAGAFGAGVRMRYEFRRLPLSLWRGSRILANETDAE